MTEQEVRAAQDKREARKAEGKVVLRFRGNWTKYYAGDVAGFDEPLAEKLLGMEMMDTKGNRTKLCTREGSFLERVGITKGGGEAKPDSEPVGGSPDPVPVKDEETLSRPRRNRK